jgi:FecR protein
LLLLVPKAQFDREGSMLAIVRCSFRPITIISLLLGIGLASPDAFSQQLIGVNGAVNPEAMSIPPGGLPRRLVLGQDVLFNERITTAAEGQTQILFVDESTLSVGPNSNMVIDQFVYDPNAGTGKFAASLMRGVFRFVGGKISKQDNAVSFRTPAATIGIRGGVMLVDLAPSGKLSVIFVFGNGATITGLNGVSQTIFRPGFEVTVSGPGASPSDPAPAPPGSTAALLAQLDGRAGRHGGAPTVPTEVMVENSGIAAANSANGASIQAAAQTQPWAGPQNVSPTVQLVELNNQNVSVSAAIAAATPITTGSSAPVMTVLNRTEVATPIPTTTPETVPNSTPIVSQPTPSNPTTVASQPTPSNPTPVASQPTPSNPTTIASQPTPSNPTPVASQPTPSNPTPIVSQPTPSNPTPSREFEEHEWRRREASLSRSDRIFEQLEREALAHRFFPRINGVDLPATLSGPVPSNHLLPNGPCQCQYLHWGYWMADVTHPSIGGIAQGRIAFRSTARLPYHTSGMFDGIRRKP